MAHSSRRQLSSAPTWLDFRLDLVDDRGSDAPRIPAEQVEQLHPVAAPSRSWDLIIGEPDRSRWVFGTVGGLVSVLVGMVAALLASAGELLALIGSVIAMVAGDGGRAVALLVLAVSLVRLAHGVAQRSRRAGR